MQKIHSATMIVVLTLAFLTTGCKAKNSPEQLAMPVNFKNAELVRVNAAVARISPDGATLMVDASNSPSKNGETILSTVPGVLKKNTSYIITFRYQITSPVTQTEYERGSIEPKDAYLSFVCLSHRQQPKQPNLLRIRGMARSDELQTIRVFTGDEYDDAVFRIDIYKNPSATIRDFQIREGIADEFVPISKNPDPFTSKLGNVPTGAKDFEVKLPDSKGEIVEAEKFGFTESNPDNFEALSKALQYCRQAKAAKLVLAPGTYRFVTGDSSIRIEGMKNFELDGRGAMLLFHKDLTKRKFHFEIDNNDQTRIRNINIDWDWSKTPLASLVEVVGVNGESVDYKFVDYVDYPKKDVRVVMVRTMDPTTRNLWGEKVFHHHYEFYAGQRVPKTEWLKPNILRVTDNGGVWEKERMYRFKPGQFFRMMHYYYDGGAFYITNNRDLTFEDVHVLSTPGNGFAIRTMQHNWQLIRCSVAPPPGRPERVTSCTADTYFHERTQGNMKMIGCHFKLGNDDALNILDQNAYVEKSGPNSVVTKNLRAGKDSFHVGDSVELRGPDFAPINFHGTIKAVNNLGKVVAASGPWGERKVDSLELVFDRPVSGKVGDGLVLFNRAYNSGNVIIRDCIIENYDGRAGLLQVENMTIENSTYRFLTGGLHVKTGYTFDKWCEGYGAGNVVVRGCTFESVGLPGKTWDEMEREIQIATYRKIDAGLSDTGSYPILHDILFENNTFKNSSGLVAYINSADNVIFRNNTFENPDEFKAAHSYRGAFFATNCRNVYIVNNKYVGTKQVPFPGVFLDSGKVTNLVVQGNTIKSD